MSASLGIELEPVHRPGRSDAEGKLEERAGGIFQDGLLDGDRESPHHSRHPLRSARSRIQRSQPRGSNHRGDLRSIQKAGPQLPDTEPGLCPISAHNPDLNSNPPGFWVGAREQLGNSRPNAAFCVLLITRLSKGASYSRQPPKCFQAENARVRNVRRTRRRTLHRLWRLVMATMTTCRDGIRLSPSPSASCCSPSGSWCREQRAT